MPEGSTANTTDQHGNSLSPVFGAAPVNATSPTRPTTPIHDDPNPDFADLTPNTKALLEELVARPAPTNTLANTSLPSAKGGKGGAQYAGDEPAPTHQEVHLGHYEGTHQTTQSWRTNDYQFFMSPNRLGSRVMLVPDPDVNADKGLTFNEFVTKYYEPTEDHDGLKDTLESIDCTLSFITEMEHRALNRIGVEKGEDNLKHWDVSEFPHRSRLVQKGNVWPTVKDTGHDEVSGKTFIVDKSWPCDELAQCRFPHDHTAKTCNAMCQIRL